MKLLIDTGGCHPSLLKPYIVENNYPETMFNTPLITYGGCCESNFKAQNGPLEYVLFNFHEYFEDFIDIRDLGKLSLNIDLNNKLLFNLIISYYFILLMVMIINPKRRGSE